MTQKRTRKELQNDLLFYIDHYKEITSRSRKRQWDKEIEELVEELKKLDKNE